MVAEVGGDGSRAGDGRGGRGGVEPHHVRELSVEGKGRVVELVAVLPLAKGCDGLEVVAEGLPFRKMQWRTRVVALGTDALETGPIFAVVEGGVD